MQFSITVKGCGETHLVDSNPKFLISKHLVCILFLVDLVIFWYVDEMVKSTKIHTYYKVSGLNSSKDFQLNNFDIIS